MSNQDEQKKQPEADIIQQYKMIEGDYKVIIRVLEANDLKPHAYHFAFITSKDDACNSQVTMECMGQKKKSSIIKNNLEPIYNQSFSFLLKGMTHDQLQQATINFAVTNNKLLKSVVLGTYEVDLTSVYFKLNHEIYRTWLTLTDPTDEREGVMGYLLVNVCILGPHDHPQVHDVTSQKKDNAPKENTLVPSKVQQQGHQIQVKLLKGEHMPSLDALSDKIDAYVQIKYSGASIKSSVVTSRNPIWNQNLSLACMLPNQSKFIHFEVFDRDLLEADEMVGNFTVPFNSVLNKKGIAQWANLYGAPVGISNKSSDMMTLYGQNMGSHYRGRILYQISTLPSNIPVTHKKPLIFQFPQNPEPTVEQKSYLLRIDLFQMIEVPQREHAFIYVGIGPYLLKSKSVKILNGRAIWNEQLEEKKVLLPKDINQVPDIIFYFADKDEECRRHSFARVKASLVLDNIFDTILTLKEDKSLDLVKDDEFGGFLSAQVSLFSQSPPERELMSQEIFPEISYELRVFLYIARDLPPSDESGASDAIVNVRCAGRLCKSTVVNNTLNPDWYETLRMPVSLQPIDKSRFAQGMMVMMYDQDEDKSELMGRCWITFKNTEVEKDKIKFYWHRPKWYNLVYDATNQTQGKVLLSYALIKIDESLKLQITPILPVTQKLKFNLFCLGVRGLIDIIHNRTVHKCYIEFSIHGSQMIRSDEIKVQHRGLKVNQMLTFEIQIPRNLDLSPIMEVRLMECGSGQSKMILGLGQLDFIQFLNKYKDAQIQQDVSYPAIEIDLPVPWERDDELDIISEEKQKNHIFNQIVGNIHNEQKPSFKNYPNQYVDGETNQYDYSKILGTNHKKIKNTEEEKKTNQFIQYKQFEPDKKLKEDTQQIDLIKKPQIQIIQQQFQQDKNSSGLDQKQYYQSGPNDPSNQSEISSVQMNTHMLIHQEFQDYTGQHALQNITDISIRKVPKQRSVVQKISQEIFPQQISLEKNETYPDFQSFRINSQQFISQATINSGQILTSSTNHDYEIQIEEKVPQKVIIEKKDKNYLKKLKSEALKLIIQSEEIKYEPYDTDPDEDLDITLEFLKGREVLKDDLEREVKMNKRMNKVQFIRGQTRGSQKEFLMEHKEEVSQVGVFKYIFVDSKSDVQKKVRHYQAMMRPKDYVIRLYIMEGIQINAEGGEQDSDLYLKIHHAGQTYDLKSQTLQKSSSYPLFYYSHELLAEIPGTASYLTIQVWQDERFQDEMVGKTVIDLEDRYFSKTWQAMKIKPIECRDLMDEQGSSVGRLQLWIDLIERSQVKIEQIIHIEPPPRFEFELRVIIWSTKAYTFKDEAEKCNDVFVRAGPGNQEMQETDVHWRCRGTGSFNWRMKWKVHFPMRSIDFGNDLFQLQMWDKDLIDSNDLIGEVTVDLNIHKMIDKACKRRKATQARMKIQQLKPIVLQKKKSGNIEDKIWYDVFHPEQVDEKGNKILQGKVLVSLELIPVQESGAKLNGLGRSQPNIFPNLPEPSGRLSFDVSHPLDFLKEILGPELYSKICRSLCLAICLSLLLGYGWQFLVQLILYTIHK